jgi:spermidine/putrescine transport system permease protein
MSLVALTVVVLFVAAPLLLIVIFSLNESPFYGFPLRGLGLRWYRELARSQLLIEALGSTVLIGAIAALISGILGSFYAYWVARKAQAGRLLPAIGLWPLLIPSLVLGIGMQTLVVRSEVIQLGYTATTLGYLIYLVPFVILIVWAWLAEVDWTVEEVGRDLGASYATVLRRITFPLAWVGIRAGIILGFLLAFNDYNIGAFLARGFNTLPIYVAGQGSFGIEPDVLALSTIIIGSVVVAAGAGAPVLRRVIHESESR